MHFKCSFGFGAKVYSAGILARIGMWRERPTLGPEAIAFAPMPAAPERRREILSRRTWRACGTNLLTIASAAADSDIGNYICNLTEKTIETRVKDILPSCEVISVAVWYGNGRGGEAKLTGALTLAFLVASLGSRWY
jgi:hypothetical protein